ncbi:mannosyltransferase putative-domain-containing protein [Chytriomyces sp. MP71]|nr:mannosyltransferase putative-domain-containing protein [Chytriomyces sp. MP71]
MIFNFNYFLILDKFGGERDTHTHMHGCHLQESSSIPVDELGPHCSRMRPVNKPPLSASSSACNPRQPTPMMHKLACFRPLPVAAFALCFCFVAWLSELGSLASSQDSVFSRNTEFDIRQIQLLDWMNGDSRINASWESGLNDTYHPRPTLVEALAHARSLSFRFDQRDFVQLAQRTRTLLILLRISMNQIYTPYLDHNETRAVVEEMTRLLKHGNRDIIERVTRSLFPWMQPTFSSIQQMHNEALNSKEDWSIVITGGPQHVHLVHHLITSLRFLHNVSEPIHLYMTLPPSHTKHPLTTLPNVTIHDPTFIFPRATQSATGWGLKPYALLSAPSRRVLLLDADIVPLQNLLTAVQRHAAWLAHSVLLFRDRRIHEPRFTSGPQLLRSMTPSLTPYARTLGYTHNHGETHAMESGFLALDKSNLPLLVSLLLAAAMNTAPASATLYARTYGDKESYWFAMETLRVPYAFHPAYGSCVGNRVAAGRVCGIALLQVDADGEGIYWNGGITRDRSVLEGQFLELDGVVVDSKGEVVWSEGHCATGEVRNLTASEVKVVERLKELYLKCVIELKGVE